MASNNKLAAALEKFGVTVLSDPLSPCIVSELLPTGCLALDALMGGGIPVGRIVEIFGDASSGKSLVAEQVAALVQQVYKDEAEVLYMDSETAVSITMMRKIGVDVDKLMYATPKVVEDVFDMIAAAIDNKDPNKLLFIVWDSIAATSTRNEMEGAVGKHMMGEHARLISQGLRKLSKDIAQQRVACLFLNQMKHKLGVVFGDDATTFGGDAVEFYSTVRIKLGRGSKIRTKDKKKVIGMITRATCVKNKVANPFMEATLPIYFGSGIDDRLAAYDFLVDYGFMVADGNYKQITIGGKENKVQRGHKSWDALYDGNYDELTALILGTNTGD